MNTAKGKLPKTASGNSLVEIDDLEDGEISNGLPDEDNASSDSPDVVFESDGNDNMFELDLNPVEEDENEALVKVTVGSHLNKTLVGLGPVSTPDSVKSTPRGGVCFNCSGPHSLIECTEPRDNRRIMRNRSFHQQRKGDGLRMHSTQGNEFKPGEISDKLRKALDINKFDIPEWILRMRNKGLYDGYPPGYMKAAMEADTIPFLEGNDSSTEKTRPVLKINPSKLVRYPGFNHFDSHLKDGPEYRPYRIPTFEQFTQGYVKWVQENVRPSEEIVKEIVTNEKALKSRKKKSNGNQNEEVEVVETTTAETISILSPPPVAPDLDMRATTPVSMDVPSTSTPSNRLSAITAIPGTPIMIDRPASSQADKNKPDLTKWADAHEESTGKKGFLKEMMQMLNEYKQKK
uniref:PSP proline-rich domain-containing protein n=1 Tax=Acrobeloides nanus TaxID=290746 RepID=A0A914BWD2_9BILA